jgi:nucleoside-diphosphate-sugar epimerase
MRALVTGAAGFIGSSLIDRLLSDGHEVVGLDCFTPYYDIRIKKDNISTALTNPNFRMLQTDLSSSVDPNLLDGISHVFHQAGQPGVRASWESDFDKYVECNITGTQKLLELSRKSKELKSFVAASSSSVYGSPDRFPSSENDLPCPVSPYGATKLASENLCSLYGEEFGLPIVSLRYFTVYGPRQRPDMAMNRIIGSLIFQREFDMNGSGDQIRDFTFVDDVVDALLLASNYVQNQAKPKRVFNIGGGVQASLGEVVAIIEDICGSKLKTAFFDKAKGDPLRTSADCDRARQLLGWEPKTDLENGLGQMVKWQTSAANKLRIG